MPRFVTFGIDPGDTSGWGVATCPEIPAIVGIATTIEQRVEVCRYVKEFSKGLPIVVGIEDWTIGGPNANYHMFKSLGESAGRWLEQVEAILGITKKHVVRTTPQQWRNGLFTPGMVRNHSGGEGLKRLACAFVSPPDAEPVKNHNAAEAGCIACWLHCSEEGVVAIERLYTLRKRAKVGRIM
jgi:hypothetical protein